MRVVLVTLDAHLAGAVGQARRRLRRDLPEVELRVHVAADWSASPSAAERCRADVAAADIVVATQLFLEDHVAAVLPAIEARRDRCDAVVALMCLPALVRQTRLGRLDFARRSEGGPAALLRRVFGGGARAAAEADDTTGERQWRALRRAPKLLRWVPGPAQDVRAYLLAMQYWLAGSGDNVADLVRMLVHRYAAGPREALRERARPAAPREYPAVGVYHPSLPAPHLAADVAALPAPRDAGGRVGLLLMRSYLLAGNTRHYDAVIAALEARGLAVVPAFAAGLDGRPAAERCFRDARGAATVDAVVSLTGFSLVGGPAFHDAARAHETLAALDVPYLVAPTLEFQSVADWSADARGLNALQATLQVALPELDGATSPVVFGGRDEAVGAGADADGDGGAPAAPIADRVERLAGRVARLVALRRTPPGERRVGIVLFNFPPNAGSVGTAAFLAVFASLHRTLGALRAAGYDVEVPATVDELRRRILEGNAERHGTPANVHASIPVDAHVRGEPHLAELERTWGAAPGRHGTDGARLFVLGERFGNAFVGVQPAFGFEGDPMRLLLAQGQAPTHAFAAFYRWLRDDFAAHTLLHFGTHGALEFMPGKQVGLSAACWPDRLVGDVPNVYLYAANNPSEGALAKRRGGATLVSYLTPPMARAGLYRGLRELDATIRRLEPVLPADAHAARDAETDALVAAVQAQAAALDLAPAEPRWNGDAPDQLASLRARLRELERAVIPTALHVVGEPPTADERVDTLLALAATPPPEWGVPALDECVGTDRGTAGGDAATDDDATAREIVRAVVRGDAAHLRDLVRAAGDERLATLCDRLAGVDRLLRVDAELPGLLRALDGRFVPPAPGGDLLRTPAILPTGRNVYGFDPYALPSAAAMREGRLQAERLLARHVADGHPHPTTVAVVLWGTDNMKTGGVPLAVALALLGAEPRLDALGRIAGARLVPLDALGRPRVDVLVTVSGIFRDLCPQQVRVLADAARLAAEADEPVAQNPVRAHADAFVLANGGTRADAARRVFGNATGAYGANVNQLVEASRWQREDELAEAWTRRKGFAYGADSAAEPAPALLASLLADVALTYQNLDGAEAGLAELDQYVDSLGGLARAVRRAGGRAAPTYVGDFTGAAGAVRTASEQVALEVRTRTLNPRWYEGMLRSGHEGARIVATHATGLVGWAATADAAPAWTFRAVGETYVLDPAMRRRLAELNPHAAVRLSGRLLEAHDRGYWSPDDAMLAALRDAHAELEDALEGIHAEEVS